MFNFKIIIMKIVTFLLLSIFLISCSNLEESELPPNNEVKMNSHARVNKLEVVKLLKDPVYVAYNIQHKRLFKRIYKTFKPISLEDRKDLLALFPLYMNNPEQYLSLAQEKIKETVGIDAFEDLLNEIEILQSKEKDLFQSQNYISLDEVDKELIIKDLFYNLPSMSILLNPVLQTKSVSESQCVQDCAASRDETIQEAAFAALCGMAGGLATCVTTGGWGTVAGLVSAFLAAHAGDMAIKNAWNAYERCIKYC